jgi:RsmE family RNA methyltransferase
VNLLLLHDEDFAADGTVLLTGRRLRHAREVLRAAHGDVLRVGRLHGKLGEGEVLHLDDRELRLRVTLNQEPPPRARVDLLLAMPRPKALKRLLPAVASLGVDRVVLVNAARVEKSYFGSSVLAPAFVETLFALGLEQARDTIPPQLLIRDRFRTFVEDELDPFLAGAANRWLAHPLAPEDASRLPPPEPPARVVLAVGPEGGWVPFEVQLLEARGFRCFTLGPRILRVETAVPLLLGQVALLRKSSDGEPTSSSGGA